MDKSSVRVPATGGWTFVVGREFELLDNRDSVQAVHGTRIVYVSSFGAGTRDVPVRSAQLRTTAERALGSGERLSHIGQSVEGDAEISRDEDAWRLRGTMCTDGTFATCAIDFQDAADRDWAVEVWRSLRWDGVAA